LIVCHPRTGIDSVYMIDAQNSSIAKRVDDVGVLAVVQGAYVDHHVAVRRGWIENFLRTSNIICCIVDARNIVHIHAIVFEEDAIGVTWLLSTAVGWSIFGLSAQLR
jgi:hypothetical protein